MIGPTEAVVLTIGVAWIAVVLFTIVDIVSLPATSWRSAGRSKVYTLLLVVFLPVIGVPYHFVGDTPRRHRI